MNHKNVLCVAAEVRSRFSPRVQKFRPKRVEIYLAQHEGIAGAKMEADAGALAMERVS